MNKEPITFDKFIRWAMVIAAILAVFFIINILSTALLPFVIAWLLAYLVYPIVKFIQYRLHVPTRILSILLTMLLVIAIFAGIFLFIVPPFIEQLEKFVAITSTYLHQISHNSSIAAMAEQWIKENRSIIEKYFNSPDIIEAIKVAMPKLFAVIGQTANIIISIAASIITLLYMVFILLDYEALSTNWIRIFPPKSRPFWSELSKDVERELNNYIRGQGLVSLIMSVLFAIGFTIIGFPMAIGMGILIGLLNLIPYLHTFALIPSIFIALVKAADTGQNFWFILLSVLAVFAIVQLICDMIVTPKIMGKAMRLNPAILLLSLSIWGTLLGIIGLIIALPLTTLIIAYWKKYVTKEVESINNTTIEK